MARLKWTLDNIDCGHIIRLPTPGEIPVHHRRNGTSPRKTGEPTMSITEIETKTKERNDSIWTVYNVRWDFIRGLCGSVLANGNRVGPCVDSRAAAVLTAGGKSI